MLGFLCIWYTDGMKKVIDWVGQMSPVVRALVMSNLVSLLLFLVRVIATQSSTYWFLFWNLFLAWVPVLLVWLLKRSLRTQLVDPAVASASNGAVARVSAE
jgi:hypothetical protein